MKKLFAALAAVAGSFAAFAEGGAAAIQLDTTFANNVIAAGETGMQSFVQTNAPIIGGIALSLVVFSLIFVGIRLLKRTGRAA